MIQASFESNFESFRIEARRILALNTNPDQIIWENAEKGMSLFGFAESQTVPATPLIPSSEVFHVPKEFVSSARTAALARNTERWDLFYRLLYRLKNENRALMKVSFDSDVRALQLMEKSVRRDLHKMHAFVRFKETTVEGQKKYVAWYRPEHLILRQGSEFFMRRFGDRPWSIFTPDESAHWDLHSLNYSSGIPLHEFKEKDEWDELWKSYYRSIFNPARMKLKAMQAEFPEKYWEALPEAEVIRELIREAAERLQKMRANQNVRAEVPAHSSLSQLKSFVKNCQACPLYEKATQSVFGEGRLDADVMIVGEQPGESEDLTGKPMSGPAGQLLESVLTSLGQTRSDLYITNVVKHFKWTAQGQQRLHKTASGAEMHACKPWLEAEIDQIKPKVILALGRSAGLALLGRTVQITKERGLAMPHSSGATVILSWHPAAILRSFDESEKQQRLLEFTEDLKLAFVR